MNDDSRRLELAQKALLHLYNSAVVGSIQGISMIIGISGANTGMNPRFKDLRAVYDSLGPDARGQFYAAIAAISEFAVYRTLDFIETYNRFDSEDNEDSVPRLSLSYIEGSPVGENTTSLVDFGKEQLGPLFKKLARQDDVKALVAAAIAQKAVPDKPLN